MPPGRPVNEAAIALRTTLSQEVTDFALDKGLAFPVYMRHNTIADAMKQVADQAPAYEHDFTIMLAHPDEHPGGWEDFLVIVSRQQAKYFHHAHLQQSGVGADEFMNQIGEKFLEWYRSSDLIHKEKNCGPYGFEFITAIKTTEKVAKLHSQLISGRFLDVYYAP